MRKFKKVFSFVLSLALILSALPFGAFAFTASAATSGIFTYSVKDNVATITRVDSSVSGIITIPAILDGYEVKNVSESAFYKCSSITAINVDEDSKNFSSIEGVLFNKEATNLIRYPIGKASTSYAIPDGVISICGHAFQNCRGLVNITMPNSVTNIGEYAFEGCLNAKKITISNNITSIGDYAFKLCTSLASVTIPDSVTSIGDMAFYMCSVYMDVYINDINAWCNINFEGSSSNPFSIFGKIYLNDVPITDIVIPNTITKISDYAFSNCGSLTSITIPDSVTSIGDDAFSGCISLTSITIPDSVTSIGDYAFSGCRSLTSVTIGNSVASIGTWAFYNCTSLTSITIPDSVTSIGGRTFYNCTSLTAINVDENNGSYCSIDGVLFDENITTLVQYPIGKTITSYDIANDIISISDYAFAGCDSITKVTIGDSVTNVGWSAFSDCDNLIQITFLNPSNEGYYGNIDSNIIIYGYRGSYSENFALWNGNLFYDIDTYTDYYANVGTIGFVIRDKNGMGLSGCTVVIDGIEYVSDLNTLYVNIPDGYTGDVTISKDGYITSTLPVEQLEKFTFFVMYPDTEEAPVVQHMMLRESSNTTGSFSDLLICDEYIYDLGNKRHDLYLQIASNGHTISSIYLKQGNTIIKLENGLNKDINTNGLFNSKNGTIYLCIETTEGKIYKMDSNIVALEKRLELDASIDGEISGVVDEEMEAIGGWEFSGKLNLGDLPVSFEIGEDYSVKGTIGVKGNDANVATWYEAISSTIKAHDKNGDKEYDSETVEELVKGLEESGADIEEGYSSFGIDVKGSIIGYIEGKWNPELARLEDVKVGAIFKIAGEMSYVQQSAIMVAAVPVPYYWTVEFELELAAKIGAEIEIDQENHIDFEIAFPEISFDIEIAGSLCLGVEKVIGGGGKVKGNVKLTFVEPNYDFTSCTVEAALEFGLTGQLAGFSGDIIMWNGTHELYSSRDTYDCAINNMNLMSEYVENSVLLASVYNFDSVTYLTNQSNNGYSYTFKTNGYTYASPAIARLSDGTAVMVWVDYDNNRLDINKTALYYSVYDLDTNTWSTPTQVENDGTADDLPVLKTINNKIYLVWNDADSALSETDDFKEMLACMGVSYAEFDGSAFTSISSVSGENNYMDICADITVVDGEPNVVWLANENNDLFGQSGVNKIMSAKYANSNWSLSCALETTDIINSFTVVEENKNVAIYYSASDSGEYCADNYEIFKLSVGTCEQITNNQYADTSVTSYDNVVYWKSVDAVYSCDESIECKGIADRYAVVEDVEGYRAIIFTANGNSNETTYMVCAETENGFGEPMVLTSGDYISGGFAAYFDSEKLNFVSNEINVDNMCSTINLYSFKRDSKLTVENVYYDKYTLMKGSELRTTLSVKNVGFDMASGYTIYAYSNDNLLASQYVGALLLPGDNIDIKLLINIPLDIDVETIRFYVVLDDEEIDLNNIDYTMALALVDISVENTVIVSDQNTTNLYTSIVNRGIKDISEAVITLHEGGEDGEILNFITVKNLDSRTETIVSFDISDYVKKGTIYYVTVDVLTGEDFIGNNSDFTIANSIKQNEIVVEDFRKGDVNDDGRINNKDLGLLMQYLNDWEITIVEEASDVNADGKINNKDYGLLMQYLNDWDVVLK